MSLLERALVAEVPADADHILDAALELAAASGIRHLTMEDVARKAGVGRMTVYRRFGTRDALIDALAGREARRCLNELDAAAPMGAPLEGVIVDGFNAAMRLIREHPLLARLARVEPESVRNAFTEHDSALLSMCVAFIAARLREAGVADPEERAELFARLAVSFVLLPDTALPVDDPDLPRRLFLPLLRGQAQQ